MLAWLVWNRRVHIVAYGFGWLEMDWDGIAGKERQKKGLLDWKTVLSFGVGIHHGTNREHTRERGASRRYQSCNNWNGRATSRRAFLSLSTLTGRLTF